MYRRKFIQESSLALMAVAGLPAAIRKNAQTTPSNYKSELVSGKTGQTQYSITIYHSTVEKIAQAQPQEKALLMEIKYYDAANFSVPSSSATCKYAIENSEVFDKANNIWKLTIKLQDGITGSEDLVKNLPKDLKFLVKPYSYAEIRGKKDKLITNMAYNSSYAPASTGTGTGDCFLTTACTQEQQLADNCDELETLRSLRDQFMANTEEGKQLIAQYTITGPQLVRAIDACINKSEIYQYMYQQMILPAVSLVKAGKMQEATAYYCLFVAALKEKYNREA